MLTEQQMKVVGWVATIAQGLVALAIIAMVVAAALGIRF